MEENRTALKQEQMEKVTGGTSTVQVSMYCPDCGALMTYAGAVRKDVPGVGNRIVVTFKCLQCGHVEEHIADSARYFA